MTVDNLYIVNYCHKSCAPLQNIMRLPKEEAFALAHKMAAQNQGADAFYRFADFENYYPERRKTDALLYNCFVGLGGRPLEKHPLSFVLQGSDFLNRWFDNGIVTTVPLKSIPPQDISFTYGDSMTVLKKYGRFDMMTKEMLFQAVSDYDGTVEEFLENAANRYHYIEVQVWNDACLGREFIKKV